MLVLTSVPGGHGLAVTSAVFYRGGRECSTGAQSAHLQGIFKFILDVIRQKADRKSVAVRLSAYCKASAECDAIHTN
jgi:hypothetical protein